MRAAWALASQPQGLHFGAMPEHHQSPGAFWDERFKHERFAYGREPNPFLAAQAHHFPPASAILSLAEGEGRNAMYLAKLGHQVLAQDASAEGLRKLSTWAEAEGLQVATEQSDLREAELGEARWDVVLNVFGHFPGPERQALNARIARALKPGGLVLLVLFHPEQLGRSSGGPKQLAFLATPADLVADFPGFEVLVAELQCPVLDEGPLHQGEARVCCFLARKPLE